MAGPLIIAERRVGSCSVLQVSGKLVAEEAPIFSETVEELINNGLVEIVINLREVSTLDSGGVGALVASYLRARRAGGNLKLVCMSSHACRVLRLAGLLKIFETYDNEERAVGSFRAVTTR